jgi:hypothetical protein
LQETIRVEAPDLRSAMSLAAQAAATYRSELVPLPYGVWEVRVLGAEAHGDIVALVEEWLDAAGVATTNVHLDGHVYTMNRRAAVAGV